MAEKIRTMEPRSFPIPIVPTIRPWVSTTRAWAASSRPGSAPFRKSISHRSGRPTCPSELTAAAITCSARVKSGALPYPPPTNVHVTGSFGSANGLPSGPTTSMLSC